MPALEPKYVPGDHEPRVLERWLASDAFRAEPGPVLRGEKPAYCILIPPPNVTARLHLGHALVNTLQDVLIRAHRMKGHETLWMPGTDHAGIATQTVVEKRLLTEEGKRRTEYGREEFVEKVQQWKDDYETQITDQLKAIGCSCDWSRQRFTMDDICARAVREAFFRLFRDGLIYRGKRLVNWDPVTQTALADDEVEMEEIEGSFSYMRYPLRHATGAAAYQPVTWSELVALGYPAHLKPKGEGVGDDDTAFVTVATTRPETYLGDTAVAVHPSDPRARSLEGLVAEVPLVGRRIPIVTDDYVVMPDFVTGDESGDPKAKMATGFLKVTPAHDPNDWEIGRRHELQVINVMAPDATISDAHGWEDVGDAHIFVGLSREEAREKVVAEFRARGLLEKRVPYIHSVGHSYRSHVPVEPYLSDQWYCKVSDDRLVGEAQRALALGQRTEESLGGTSSAASGGTGFQPVSTPDVPERLTIHKRHLPHWQTGGSTYFVTLRVREGELTEDERQLVLDACFHFDPERCRTHLAVVMPDHVHLLITPKKRKDGWWPLNELMHSIKSFTANAINRSRERSGSLWQDEYFDQIVRHEQEFREKWNYMLLNPVKAGISEHVGEYPFIGREDGLEARSIKGRKNREGEKTSNSDHALSFTPERYAKTYESWHDGLRDWCISRQLWWGHRIPVWVAPMQAVNVDDFDQFRSSLEGWQQEGRLVYEIAGTEGATGPDDARLDEASAVVCLRDPDDADVCEAIESRGFVQDPDVLDTWFSSALWPLSTMGWPETDLPPVSARQIDPEEADAIGDVWVKRVGTFKEFIGTEGEQSGELIDQLLHLRDHAQTAQGGRPLAYQLFSEAELLRDGAAAQPLTKPDDISEAEDLVCAVGVKATAPMEATKFGLVDIPALLLQHGFTNTAGLFDAFNPTSVLCTGRDIITLWVSRMVMFNRHFTADGRVPYRDVYINPIVQDGHGQRMSKSLGNGVDPLDIVHSHGADALRLVLCQIATSTQDVRMPVDTVCPHTGEVFEPKTVTTPAGHVVAAPVQACPSDPNKKMVTAYGVASGQAKATEEMPLARNTSSRFDIGRNFCTKLWNAVRFAMLSLEEAGEQNSEAVTLGELALVDRWMVSRLRSAVARIDEALSSYQFNRYAELVYDLLWRDFCDWYLEAIKPTVKTSASQRAVLHASIDVILRVLHPIMPYVTEVLHEHLRGLPRPALVEGLDLSWADQLCVTAWPEPDGALASEDAERAFAEAQRVVEAVRQTRAAQQTPTKVRPTAHVDGETASLIERAGGVVEHLAGLGAMTTDEAPAGETAVEVGIEGRTVRLTGLSEGVDPAALRAQLEERAAKLEKDVTNLRKRLDNPGYVQKAPAKLVEETRGQLTRKDPEPAETQARLKDLP